MELRVGLAKDGLSRLSNGGERGRVGKQHTAVAVFEKDRGWGAVGHRAEQHLASLHGLFGPLALQRDADSGSEALEEADKFRSKLPRLTRVQLKKTDDFRPRSQGNQAN